MFLGMVSHIDIYSINVRFTHPSGLNVYKWPEKEDIQTVDKKFVLLVLNNQDEPLSTGSEARLYKLVSNNLITTLFNEYKHYYLIKFY